MNRTMLKSLQAFLIVNVLMFSIMWPSATAAELRQMPIPKFQLASATTMTMAHTTMTMAQPTMAMAQTQKKTYAPWEEIVVEFSGFPRTNDWIAVAPAGSSDGPYTRFLFTKHMNSGTLTFNGLPAGNYEARGYFNWPRERYSRQTTYAFTVVANSESGSSSIAPDCVNCSAGVTAKKGQIVLPATLEAGKMIVNPFNRKAILKISSTGEWNFRAQGFTLGDGDGYAQGSCKNVDCPAPSLVPGTLITLDLNTEKLLGHGKAHNVKLEPNQKVIILMNDERKLTGYGNNSGSLTVSYKINKIKKMKKMKK